MGERSLNHIQFSCFQPIWKSCAISNSWTLKFDFKCEHFIKYFSTCTLRLIRFQRKFYSSTTKLYTCASVHEGKNTIINHQAKNDIAVGKFITTKNASQGDQSKVHSPTSNLQPKIVQYKDYTIGDVGIQGSINNKICISQLSIKNSRLTLSVVESQQSTNLVQKVGNFF